MDAHCSRHAAVAAPRRRQKRPDLGHFVDNSDGGGEDRTPRW